MRYLQFFLLIIGIVTAFCAQKPVYANDELPTCGPESWAKSDTTLSLTGESGVISALDQENNLIVTMNTVGTGNNLHEWITVKYDAQGTALWRYTYPGVGDVDGLYNDQGSALTLDAEGNIYLIGSTLTARYNDIAVIKLSPSGQELWTQRYDGVAPSGEIQNDWGRGIAVANGQVYAFGQSWSDETRTGSIVLRYDLDGALIEEMALPVYPTAQFVFLPNGDWVVAGLQYTAPGQLALGVIAYTADGTERWHTVYNRPDLTWLVLSAPPLIHVDSHDHLYLVVQAYQQDDQGHAATVTLLLQYTSSGQFGWDRLFYTFRTGVDLAIDPVDNVYVLGNLDDGSGETWSSIMALRYDGAGTLTATFDRPIYEEVFPLHLALDGDVGVVIIGQSGLRDGQLIDTATTMYFSPVGDNIWVARHPISARDFLQLQIVAQSYITVLGHADDADGLLLLRYPTVPPRDVPQVRIEDLLIGDGDHSTEINRLVAYVKIALDRPAVDTTYVEYFTQAGSALPQVTYESRAGTAILVRGDQESLIQIPIIGDEEVNPDLKQFSVRLGCVQGATVSDGDAIVTVFDDDADRRLWTKTYGDPFTTVTIPQQVFTDQDDNLYIVAGHQDATGISGLLLKYQPDGALTWQQSMPVSYVSVAQLTQTQGWIYTTATLSTTQGFDIVTQQTSTRNGAMGWRHQYDSSVTTAEMLVPYNDYVSGLAYDAIGGAVVVGQHQQIVEEGDIPPNSDAMIIAITPSGATKWAQVYAGPNDSIDDAKGVGFDRAGNAYVIGVSYTGSTTGQLFWLVYDPNGMLLRSQIYNFPDAFPSAINTINIAADGAMTLAVDADPFGYVMRIAPNGDLLWRTTMFGTRAGIQLLVDARQQTYVFLPATLKLLNRQGNIIRSSSLAAPGFLPSQSVAMGGDGLLYGASEFGPDHTTTEAFVGAADQWGNRLWLQSTYTDQGADEAKINLVAPLASTGAYVVGYHRPANASGYQLFLQRYQAPLLPVRVDIQSITWQEAADQNTTACVPVVLSQASTTAIHLTYATRAGTATDFVDFTPQYGTLTIAPGQQRACIEIPIANDEQSDNAETFFVRLTKVENAAVGESLAAVVIIDAAAQSLYLPIIARE